MCWKEPDYSAQGFKFRGIDDMINALYPALTKHGVFMAPRAVSYTQELKEVTRSSGRAGIDKHVAIMMEYDFYAEDGSKVTVGPIPAEGLDSGDKSTNKSLSSALKYALIQTFSIPTENMAEADLDSPEIGSTSRSPQLATQVSAAVEAATSAAAPAAKKSSGFKGFRAASAAAPAAPAAALAADDGFSELT